MNPSTTPPTPAMPPPSVPLPIGGKASVSPHQFLVAGIVMLSVTSLFVIGRVIAGFRRPKLLWVDAIAVLSVILQAAFVGLSYDMNAHLFTDPTTPLSKILLYTQVTNWVAALAMWCSKVPVLFLFIHLFGVERWLRVSSYLTMLVLAIAIITAAGVTSGTCNPHGGDMTLMGLLHCSDVAAQVGVGLGVVSVVVDVLIMVLPIPVVSKLNLPLHKKVGLTVMFLSGIFAVVASVISVYYKWQSKNGQTANVTAAMVCTLVESCIATAVGCVPAIYTLWAQIVKESAFYSRLTSLFSTQSRLGTNGSVKRGQEIKLSDRPKMADSYDTNSSLERIHDPRCSQP